jgi:hypothetical protein
MVRKSRNQVTKDLALKIVKKLKAVDESLPGDAHDTYGVYHNQVRVSSFGVRRSSQKDIGHDHIPLELRVGPNFAKQLGQCPKSREDYLRKIGELDQPGPQEGAE